MIIDREISKEELIEEVNMLRQQLAEQEAQLRNGEVRIASISEIANEAVISVDAEQRIILFNKGAEKIFGYSRQEIIGQSLEILIPESFRAIHRKHLRSFQASEVISRAMAERAIIYGLRKSGEQFPAEASISKLEIDQKLVFSIVLHDITKRKQMEQKLHESEENHRIIASMMSDLAYIYHPYLERENKFTWIGEDALKRITGYSVEEYNDRYIVYHPDDRQAAKEDVKRVLAGEAFRSNEYRIIRKDGELGWIRVYRQPLWDDKHENIIGLYGAISDITESKLAEQNRLQLALEKERVKILTDFITQVSHEFRTPLSIIKTSAYLLSKLAQTWDQQRHVTNIEEHTDYITALVNDMLIMTKLDSSHDVDMQRMDLHQILRSIYTKFESSQQKKHLNVLLEIADTPLWIQGDINILHEAFEHIYKNAIQFSDIGDTIKLSSKQSGSSVLIEIADTGMGIRDEDLPHIFERFYRVNKAGTLRGFGLGLAIAKRSIELHHGQIEVESEVDIGSTFRVILPVDNP